MAKKSSGKATASVSIFEKLLSSIVNRTDPEAVKKKQLKTIAKNLSHAKYKFYKISSDQILPVFGIFFFDIYKVVGPCQLLFQNQENPNMLKNMVVNYSLSERQKALEEELTEEAIKAMSAHMSAKDLKAKIKENLDLFNAEFNSDKILQIDNLYSKLLAFKAFCMYDFYFLLKKFDSSLKEQDFSRTPRFDPIDASYISEDLKDFVAVVASLPLDVDWTDVFQMFKATRGSEPIKPAVWTKIVARLRSIQASQVLDMIIQLITKDPLYQTVAETKHEQVIESYIEKVRKDATEAQQQLESAQKNSKIDSLLMQIFNTTNIEVLKGYTEANAEIYVRRQLGAYEYANGLNYLKAFLVEYVKRDVREYADLVLIRGKWATTGLSQQMSDAFHNLMAASDQITAFDEKMAEDGQIGTKLKTLLPRFERDKEAANIMRTILGDANTEARDFLAIASRNMIVFAKNVKMLLEDYQKKVPDLIINWKEIERFAEHPLQQLGVEVYKKIYLFVTLMQNYIGNNA